MCKLSIVTIVFLISAFSFNASATDDDVHYARGELRKLSAETKEKGKCYASIDDGEELIALPDGTAVAGQKNLIMSIPGCNSDIMTILTFAFINNVNVLVELSSDNDEDYKEIKYVSLENSINF